MNFSKHQSSKQKGQDLGYKVHKGAHLLTFTLTLYVNYAIAMFLLISCMNTRITSACILPGFVHSQLPKQGTKTYNKDLCRVS